MKSTHLDDTDVTALHATDWCSPVLMMKVLLGQVNDATNMPALILDVKSAESKTFFFSAPQAVAHHHTHINHRPVLHRNMGG